MLQNGIQHFAIRFSRSPNRVLKLKLM